MADVEMDKSGPLFDGRARRALHDFASDAEEEISGKGADMVRERLGKVIRHPTGYYESHIRSEVSGSAHIVTDGGVVYGGWLEGVSERNRSTRFKGYRTFRLVTQELQREADGIAERDLHKYMGRIQ